MKISELILELEKIQKEHGDLPVVISEPNEYWGSVETHLTRHEIAVEHAKPGGPKSGKSEKAVVFSL